MCSANLLTSLLDSFAIGFALASSCTPYWSHDIQLDTSRAGYHILTCDLAPRLEVDIFPWTGDLSPHGVVHLLVPQNNRVPCDNIMASKIINLFFHLQFAHRKFAELWS